MSAAAMIRTCVVHGVVLLLAGRALAQTDATNPPAPPAAAVVSASQSPPKSPPLAPDGFFQEPLFLSNSIDFMIDKVGDGGEPKSGFYPEFSNMITGSGWVSVGPGYRQFLFDRKLLIDGSAAVSWRLYKMMQARVELLANDRVTVGTQVMWRDDTQVNYFGIGSDAFDSEQSHYRMKATNLVGYASVAANRLAHIRRHAGLAAATRGHGARGSVQKRPSRYARIVPGRSGCRPRQSAGLSARRTVCDRRYARLSRPPDQWRPVSGGTDGLFRPDDRNLQFPSIRGGGHAAGAACGPALGPGVSRMDGRERCCRRP